MCPPLGGVPMPSRFSNWHRRLFSRRGPIQRPWTKAAVFRSGHWPMQDDSGSAIVDQLPHLERLARKSIPYRKLERLVPPYPLHNPVDWQVRRFRASPNRV